MTKLKKSVSQMKNVKLYGADDAHVMYDSEGNRHVYVHEWYTDLAFSDCICTEPGCPYSIPIK